MNPIPANRSNKVPEVVLAFWIIKIIATTLGETGRRCRLDVHGPRLRHW